MRRPTEIRRLLRGKGRPCSRCDYWHPTIEERIWFCIDEQPGQDGCWIWRGTCWQQGPEYVQYGLHYRGRRQAAARIVWQLTYGSIPARPRMYVDHACGQRLCVRPDHLRLSRRIGDEHPNARITTETAARILDAYTAGRRPAAIARELGVDFRTVSNIVYGGQFVAAIEEYRQRPPPRPPPH